MRALDIYCRPIVAFASHEDTRVFDALSATAITAPVAYWHG